MLHGNDQPQAFDLWDETRAEDLDAYFRAMARGVYKKEAPDGIAPNTLDDFVCVTIDASKEEWNMEQDFDPNVWLANGGLTSIYLVNSSLGGLHWKFGMGKEIEFGDEEFIDIVDDEKTAATGQTCTTPGMVQHYESYHGLTAKSAFDVVKIANVPCGMVDKFFLDTVLDRVITLLYDNTSMKANQVWMPTVVKSNWFHARKKQGLESGGCHFQEVIGSSSFKQLPIISDLEVAVITTPNIPAQDAVIVGNLTGTKSIVDETGDLVLTS